ncbi:MAG: UTP--glucose-1-phosphate uridylyltransferase [Clostridia bacterium]|nr:UTP--glucose-1-phosphate uridylyltransferase [Clostridia bacterium]MBR6620346.1 UTP--glucose-1-phosphate uridylyltransferase [Clostridia bacterium]
MKIKKAIIPAAGLGTRVLPASKAVPKEMLNIVDKPAIQYIVEEAAAAGIEDILIITNRGKGVIEDHFDHSYELEDKLKDNPSKKELYEDVLACSNIANVYFLRQKETKGLGHAIMCAKSFIGNEPFAILYGDDVIINDEYPVTKQLVDAYEKTGKGIVGVKEVPRKDVSKYCSLDVTPHADNEKLMDVHDIIEKPTEDQIMSCFSILGRVVAPPQVFDYLAEDLANTPEGEELYFTDTLARLGKEGNLLALDFDGIRYDMGNKLGIMKANCEVALNHKELGEDFKAYLKGLVETF